MKSPANVPQYPSPMRGVGMAADAMKRAVPPQATAQMPQQPQGFNAAEYSGRMPPSQGPQLAALMRARGWGR